MDFNFSNIVKKSTLTLLEKVKRGFKETGEAGLAISNKLADVNAGKATQIDLNNLLIDIQSGDFFKKDKKPEPPKSNILDDLTDATFQTEGLIPGQTPLRITNPTMRKWNTIQGIPIDKEAEIPEERRNFFFVEPGQEGEVIKRQWRNYFKNPTKYGMSEDATLEDAIKTFDQQNPQNKLEFLKQKGIDIKKKLKDFNISMLNPFRVSEAEAGQSRFNFTDIPKQSEQLYLPPEFRTEPFLKVATFEEYQERLGELKGMAEQIPEGAKGLADIINTFNTPVDPRLYTPEKRKSMMEGLKFTGNVVNEFFWRPLTGWYMSMLKEVSHRQYNKEDYISGKAGFQSLPRAMARGLLGIEDVTGAEVLEAGGVPKTKDIILDHPALATGKEIWGAVLDVLPLPILRPVAVVNRMLQEGKYAAADKLAGEVSETIAKARYEQMGKPLGKSWEELPQQTKNVAMKFAGEAPLKQFGDKSIADMFYEHPYKAWAIQARRGLAGRAGAARIPFKVGQAVTLKGEPFNIVNIKGVGFKALVQLSKGKEWKEGEPVVRASEIDIPYTVAKPVVTDAAQVQEIKNSIAEGEGILKSGKTVAGRKMSAAELDAVRRSVENAKAKIGIEPTPIPKELEGIADQATKISKSIFRTTARGESGWQEDIENAGFKVDEFWEIAQAKPAQAPQQFVESLGLIYDGMNFLTPEAGYQVGYTDPKTGSSGSYFTKKGPVTAANLKEHIEAQRQTFVKSGELKPEEVAVEPTEVKEPWQMTKSEYLKSDLLKEDYKSTQIEPSDKLQYTKLSKEELSKVEQRFGQIVHMTTVNRALSEGKAVPPEVLKDYPELAKPALVPKEFPSVAITNKVVEQYAKKSLTRGGFERKLREHIGRPEWATMSQKEKFAEVKAYIKKDLEVAKEEAKIHPMGPIDYLVDRTLDPLDPLNEFYGELLRRLGATVEAGKTVKLPEALRPKLPKPKEKAIQKYAKAAKERIAKFKAEKPGQVPIAEPVAVPPEKVITLVSQAMQKKPSLPALGMIHIKGNKVYATDLDHAIIYTADKDIGKISLPAELLKGKNLEDIKVLKGNIAQIGTLQLKGVSPEDAPLLPSLGKDVKSFSASAPELAFELARALKFASTDETRYVLQGVKLEVTPKNIRLVSTDGRRLFVVDLPTDTKQKFDVILPTVATKSLIKVMNATGEPITNIKVGKEQIEFEVGKFKVQSKLTEGEFPKYKQIIPAKTDKLYLIAKDDLISVIKEVPKNLITADNKGIDFSIKGNEITFTKEAPEVGKFTKTIPILKTDKKGEVRLITLPMQTEAPHTVDITYLADALKTIQSEEIVLGLFKEVGEKKPLIFYEPKEITRALAKAPTLRVPSVKTTPSVRRVARTTEEETISGPEAEYAAAQVATKEELAAAKILSDNDYKNVVLVKLKRLTDIAPDIVTKKQIALAYALANKKSLSKIQLHRIEKLITDKTSLAVYTKGGRIRKRVLYKHEARDLIKGLHQLFVKPYAKAVIPRKVKSPKDLERVSRDVTELPLQRVQAARLIRQWRKIIPPEIQPKTVAGWFDFAESLRGVGYERLGPTRYWMEKYERVTKVPIYSKIYLPFEMAERELNKFKIAYKKRINEAFGDLINDETARKNIKFYLSDVEEPISPEFILRTFDAKGKWIEVPAKLTDEELEVAKKIRPILRELYGLFNIPNYLTSYMPRIKKAGGIRRAYPKGNVPNELRFFAELERVGILNPQEDDALKLLYIYTNAGAKKLFYQPILEEARVIRKILNTSADKAVSNYIKEKLGFGRRGEQLSAVTADNILKSLKIEVSTDIADAFRQLYFSTTYGSALGFRLMPIARNYCQPFLLTLPEVGPKYFTRGMKATYKPGGITEAREEGWLLDWGVPFYEEIEKHIEGGRIAQALRLYNKAVKSGLYLYARVIDAQNRAITYHAVKSRFMDNLRLLQRNQIDLPTFYENIDLSALDPTLQTEVKRLMAEGNSKGAMNLQIRDIIDATQYPYRPGTEAAVGVPFGRYATQFLVWPTEYAHTLIRRWMMRGQWKKLIIALASAYALRKAVEKSTKFIFGKAISVSKWVMLGPLSRAPISPMVQFAIQMGNLLTSIGWNNKEIIDRNIKNIKRSIPIATPYGLVTQDIKDFYNASKNDWKIYDKRGRLVYQSSPTEELFRLFSFVPVELEQRRREWQEMANLDYEVTQMRREIINLFAAGKSKEAERLNNRMIEKYQDTYLKKYGILLRRVGPRDAIRELKIRQAPKSERMRRFMPGKKIKGFSFEGIKKR